jgi:hypothetical protein
LSDGILTSNLIHSTFLASLAFCFCVTVWLSVSVYTLVST